MEQHNPNWLDSTRRALPGRWNWRRAALWAAGALVVLVGVLTSFYTVAADGQAVVKRLGAVVRVTEPGLHFKLPFGIETATFLPTDRVLKEEFGFRTVEAGQRTQYAKTEAMERESLMLTGDLNVIDVEWVVQYRIADPVAWMHQVREPTTTVRDVSEAMMRQVVGNRLGSEVLTVGRVEVAAQVEEKIQAILDSYEAGVDIGGVELQDVTPPDPVKPAFNEVNEARQQKERSINLAEKERNQVLPRARGRADQTIAEAEGYATERVNRAKGEASRYEAVLAEYLQSPEVTQERLFLETLDEVAPRLGALYVVPPDAGALPLLGLGGQQTVQLRGVSGGSDGQSKGQGGSSR